MNKQRLLILLLALSVALAGGGYYYFNVISQASHPAPVADEAASLPQDNVSSEDDDIFDRVEETPTIEISESAIKVMAVRSVKAEVVPISHIIRTVGRIEVDEKNIQNINIKVEGWIEKLFVDYTGKLIKKGEPVAEIYSPELLATQQEMLDALNWGKNKKKGQYSDILSKDAKAVSEAARRRLKLWDVSDDQIKRIIKAGSPMRTLTVYSPASGVVMEKNAILGAKVMPGEKLFTIADLSAVWVIADVYESEMHFIRPGQSARISMGHLPGSEIESKVDFIYPSLDNATRTLQVRFEVKNPEYDLKPSMYTDIELSIDLGLKLAVPKSAIIDSGQRQIVYVDRGEGYFEPRQIRTGVAGDAVVEVVEGLDEGELVAESGNFLLDSEAQLKGVKPLEPNRPEPVVSE